MNFTFWIVVSLSRVDGGWGTHDQYLNPGLLVEIAL